MKRGLVLAGICALVATTARADDLDDFVNAAIKQRNIPGVAIAVVKDGALVRTGGWRSAIVSPRTCRRCRRRGATFPSGTC